MNITSNSANSSFVNIKRKQYFSSKLCYNLLKKSFQSLLLGYKTNFFIQLSYFMAISLAGYLALSVFTNPRVKLNSPSNQLDLFLTSVSATTVSSMSTVEMEVFSNSQLVILTILMLLGGEVFTSMLGIQIEKFKLRKTLSLENQSETPFLKLESIRVLGYVVLGYLFVVQVSGSLLVYSYFMAFSSARRVLNSKGIQVLTFAIFTTVSTFANCGFVPTNENMIVFKRNSGLLLILVPQILLGNTLYPVFLRITIWVLAKITKRRDLIEMMRENREMGYDHLLSGVETTLLALTGLGFISVQFTLFCIMEWNSEALRGLGLYEKIVASLFEVVNSRHAGESIVDISSISPAILVLFAIMIYLPPYTSFVPIKDEREDSVSRNGDNRRKNNIKSVLECLIFSNLSYLAIFIVLICITERDEMKNDPLNFNIFNVIIEVISAYGGVGYSMGYRCERRLNRDGECKDMWYGFAGKWSFEGKILLIMVMFFGRLKKFNMKGGKAWKFL